MRRFVLVFQALDGRRNAAAAVDEPRGRAGGDRHDGRAAQQAAELHHIPHLFANGRNDAHGGRLGVDNADGDFIRNQAGNDLRRSCRREWRSYPARPSRPQSSPRASQAQSAPACAAAIMPSSSRHRDERARQPADDGLEAMTPPFLTASFRSASAAVVPRAAADLKADFLQDARDASHRSPGVGASDRSTMPNGTPSRCARHARRQAAPCA